MSKTMTDKLYRYLFDQADVRGELVQLNDTYQQMLSGHDYPAPVQRLLGEMVAATSLLTAILKFEGEIAVQIQGEGPLRLLVVNGTHTQALRGVARFDGEVVEGDLQQMVGKGHLVITITPKEGERYQGVVGLTEPTLAGCLEQYFAQSEQLRTRLWLHANGEKAAGMLLQEMPASNVDADVEFEHLESLTDTIKAEELFGLDPEEVLHRLYHQESVQVFEPSDVEFRCTCSRERSLAALATIDRAELDSIVEEQGEIAMHCDYCGAHYRFDAVDIGALGQGGGDVSSTQH
ncbi:Hsp33 family molecular chaperone HslO [Ferrimonas balearica]|nr:Hsp33 family molecular chaperone HslO [Ferrimonas balearica]MBW3141154.1 Hsp33 family molecular chaperone HslO [Ferrimonas balearica]MBW3166009.1 Hsp33 family molecular chaperone HslO [Ferrimonas balearica]MBY6108187.1 Hsp33 family molecular chaperone HslO [Ferrimonas balearica]MBY6225680.1 Hsp33 family molecular chaperone HslO [Ferrimonas balearica]